MPELSSLHKSISSMNDAEALALILERRTSRRTPKKATKGTKARVPKAPAVPTNVDPMELFSKLSTEQQRLMILKLEAKANES